MAAINFPAAPLNGDSYTENGVTYEYNSVLTAWNRVPSTFINDSSYVYYTGALNVGIGTATPSSKLHVVGTTLLAGATNITGDFAIDTETFWVNVTNNRIGIGNVAPATKFHLSVDTTATVATLSADTAVVFSSTALAADNIELSLISGTTGNTIINFGDTVDEDAGFILYNNNLNEMAFGTNAAERMRLSSTGTLRVGDGTVATITAEFAGTDAILLPVGTTAQQPTPSAGMIRYNTTLGTFEGYTTAWTDLANVGGNVSNTGTPVNDQVAIWTSSTTVEGDSNFTWNGSILTITGDVVFGGAIDETVYALLGTTPALDPGNGTIQTHTLSGATTYSDSLAEGENITLMIDDGTANTITWPTMTWINNAGTAPTLATTGFTVISIWKVSTTLYGALIGDGT